MTVTCLTISLVKHCIVKNGRCKFARSTQFLVLFMSFFFQNSDLVIVDFFNHIEKPFLDIIEITQVRYLSREVTLLHFMFFFCCFFTVTFFVWIRYCSAWHICKNIHTKRKCIDIPLYHRLCQYLFCYFKNLPKQNSLYINICSACVWNLSLFDYLFLYLQDHSIWNIFQFCNKNSNIMNFIFIDLVDDT